MADKQKLVENFARDWNSGELPLTEIKITNKKIVEAEGKQYEVKRKLVVPVWRLDQENLNGRTYTTQLAEKVVKEQSDKTFTLKDHPEEGEGSVDDIVGVAENPHIKEGILYVDSYIVDEDFEKKLNKIIETGMGLGVSSSAYGDVDEKGNVMTEGFTIERWFDYVTSPSAKVYVTQESIVEEPKQESIEEEEKEENGKLFEKGVTNNNVEDNNVDNKKEKSMSDNEKKKMSIEEKNLKLGVKHLFEEAEQTEDLRQKRVKYEEILDYCDGVDFAEDYINTANEQIKKIDEELYELANKGKEVDSLKENSEKEKTELQSTLEEKENKLKTLEEKYDKAVEMLDELKLREQKLNEMYKTVVAEKNGMVTATEYRELDKYCEQQESEIEELKKERNKLKKQLENREKRKESTTTTRTRPRRRIEEESVEEKDNVESTEVEEKEDDYSKYENLPNFVDIKEWYERKLAHEPRIKEIKDEILSKRTLFEAQRAYMRFKDLIESTPSPYKSSYYGSELMDEQEGIKKPSIGNKLPIKEGWV